MKLICTFWLRLFSGIFASSVSNAESGGSTLTFSYDERVQVRIGYAEASLQPPPAGQSMLIYADFNDLEDSDTSPDDFNLDLTGYKTLASLSLH